MQQQRRPGARASECEQDGHDEHEAGRTTRRLRGQRLAADHARIEQLERAGAPVAARFRGRGGRRHEDAGADADLDQAVKEGALTGAMGGRAFTLVPTGPGRFRIDGLSTDRTNVEVAAAAPGARPRLLVTTAYEGDESEKETYEPVALWAPTTAELASKFWSR